MPAQDNAQQCRIPFVHNQHEQKPADRLGRPDDAAADQLRDLLPRDAGVGYQAAEVRGASRPVAVQNTWAGPGFVCSLSGRIGPHEALQQAPHAEWGSG